MLMVPSIEPGAAGPNAPGELSRAEALELLLGFRTDFHEGGPARRCAEPSRPARRAPPRQKEDQKGRST
jgi:hypothetical protein